MQANKGLEIMRNQQVLLFIPTLREALNSYRRFVSGARAKLLRLVIFISLVQMVFAYGPVIYLISTGAKTIPFYMIALLVMFLSLKMIFYFLPTLVIAGVQAVTAMPVDARHANRICGEVKGELSTLSNIYSFMLAAIALVCFYMLVPIVSINLAVAIISYSLSLLILLMLVSAYLGYAVPLVVLNGYTAKGAFKAAFAYLANNFINVFYILVFYLSVFIFVSFVYTAVSMLLAGMFDGWFFQGQMIFLLCSLILSIFMFYYMLAIALLLVGIMYKRLMLDTSKLIVPKPVISRPKPIPATPIQPDSAEVETVSTDSPKDKQAEPSIAIQICNGIVAILGVISVPIVPMIAMLFDAPNPGILSYLVYAFILSYPLVCLLSIVMSRLIRADAYNSSGERLSLFVAAFPIVIALPILLPMLFFG